ncbi:hypothetical protein [Methylocystis iwaonis]|uniref:Uncharacterized protein n=1 Tax=Methylocystis iwaonis TaxID=2885079 RepID=A0ABN6VEI6_9HYPH|nr:hypothetical protein [Methylocystis iwaonis]BDV33908.1 hypothetical protein SS37A_14370 [Methylocystis iwaonis]
MPTPQYHLQNLLGGMLSTTSDRVAFAVAGVAGSAPLWKEQAREISELAALVGPILAGLFVISKIILTWVQIWKEARVQRTN